MSRRFGSGSLGQTLGNDSNSSQKFQSSISKTFGWTLKFRIQILFSNLIPNRRRFNSVKIVLGGFDAAGFESTFFCQPLAWLIKVWVGSSRTLTFKLAQIQTVKSVSKMAF